MTPVRLEPAALRSRVKHSTTEPLRSLIVISSSSGSSSSSSSISSKIDSIKGCFSNAKNISLKEKLIDALRALSAQLSYLAFSSS